MKRKTKLFFLIILMALILAGCWGQKEVNDLGIIQVTGIDKEPDGNFRMTVLAIIPIGGTEESLDRSTIWIGSAVGTSINDASKNLRAIAPKRLVWIDNKIIVVGEEMARHGLDEIMDFFIRTREFRYRNSILVSEGKALDTLSIPADIEEGLPQELEGIIRNTEEWLKAYVPDLNDFLIKYLDKHIEAVAGRLTYYETDIDTFSTSREEYKSIEDNGEDKKKKVVTVKGSAVFKGDKLIGWLDTEETRGYRLIIGEIDYGAATVKNDDQLVSLEVRNLNSNIEAKVKEEEILFTIKLKLDGDIVENLGRDNVLDENAVKDIQKSFEAYLIERMDKTIAKAQREYESDFLGFGRILHREYPNVWKEIQNDWDTIFPRVEVKYEVTVNVDRMGERF
ncbi:germination protein, Ger(x)C family [Anaerovirgula multivorans]|uniref:Germination protein, Ger(X)C family n=1 Tax=Anaerovirgula multivorans TaxID=312168 RepID=A0A238ZXN6_9FIRM|nr:Ger(x)C family spore germination protein [Anaerovirgula multivorans]SNR87648.1 germination protein, Ger(x)C family [Anaerovirgula multivorans]